MIVLRRLLRKDDRRFAKERRPRMLHPAKRKLRYQNQVVLRKRKLVIEILLEILHRLAVQAKYLLRVWFEPSGLRFTHEDIGRRSAVTTQGDSSIRKAIALNIYS